MESGSRLFIRRMSSVVCLLLREVYHVVVVWFALQIHGKTADKRQSLRSFARWLPEILGYPSSSYPKETFNSLTRLLPLTRRRTHSSAFWESAIDPLSA